MRAAHQIARLAAFVSVVASVSSAGCGGSGPGTNPNAGWTLNPANGHWYKAVAVPAGVNWNQASAAATAAGAYLVTITDAAEGAFVLALVNSAQYWKDGDYFTGGDSGPHIGLYKDAGDWKWVTGETFAYSNWHSAWGQPDNYQGAEDKAQLVSEGAGPDSLWNDISPSNQPVAYVMEKG